MAVGLATPRPGVFVEAIHYLLVLATGALAVGLCSRVAAVKSCCWLHHGGQLCSASVPSSCASGATMGRRLPALRL